MKAAILLLVLISSAAAQQNQPRAIQDNSFLVEEAYNQEAGVIQHISTFTRLWASRDWAYTFTQEWPVPSHERHQLSYTLAYSDPGAYRGGAGIGDTYINYRYQLVGNGESRVAISPRVSLLIASGDARFGRGVGGSGVQFALPMSVALSRRFVTHTNIGLTVVPRASNADRDVAATTSLNAGQSFIWLATSRVNLLAELVWNRNQGVIAPGRTASTSTVLLNPGIRWAHRFANELEIVPGIGIPVGIGPSAGERGVFLYLSFEHPLWHEARRTE